SEMSWSQNLRNPQEFLKVGDEIEAQVLTLDRSERKMSLGIKQLTPDPWKSIVERYPIGSKHKAVVKNMTSFGVFVEIEEGIDGLIHISDLSWSKKINHPNEFTKVGETLDVMVLELDEGNRKLSLGHKQLEENPWETFETIFTLDSVHEGTVLKVTDKGSIIALPYGVEGFVPTKHMVKEDGSTLKAEEAAEFKIIEFNKDTKRIVVSHARIWEEVKAEERKEEINQKRKDIKSTTNAVKKVKDSVEKSTLGDLGVLAQLKQQMEGAESKAKKTKKAEDVSTTEKEAE
ncbi:MAG: S1 RNA-binding domain-containing protein, partial [Daejeonella sp.]